MKSGPSPLRLLALLVLVLSVVWAVRRTAESTVVRFTVEADDKKRARLNCINHVLTKIPYVDMTPDPLELPPRTIAPHDYVRPPLNEQFFVPQKY